MCQCVDMTCFNVLLFCIHISVRILILEPTKRNETITTSKQIFVSKRLLYCTVLNSESAKRCVRISITSENCTVVWCGEKEQSYLNPLLFQSASYRDVEFIEREL